MGCISSSNYCNRHRGRRNRPQSRCISNSQSSLNQAQTDADLSLNLTTNAINQITEANTTNTRRGRNEHRSPSFSNVTSNSYQSTVSYSNPNSTNQNTGSYSYYVPPTGKNKRLKKDLNKYFKSDKKISESQLKAKRDEFWDTAPAFDGKPEIWAALKAAVDALETKNFQLAQAIIDSANIILPNGLLNDCYDELGNRYQLPVYVLAKPSNLSKTKPSNDMSSNDQESTSSLKENSSKSKKKRAIAGEKQLEAEYESSEIGEEENQLKIKKKSKTKPTTSNKALNLSEDDFVQIKLRVSTHDQDMNKDLKLSVNLDESVLSLKNKIKGLANVEVKCQRLYFGGRLLKDKEKLRAHKLRKNVVIQVIVREDATKQPKSDETNNISDNINKDLTSQLETVLLAN